MVDTVRLARDLDGSFEQLVLEYQDPLYRFALRLTGCPADAEDAAQDAFVRAYRWLKSHGNTLARHSGRGQGEGPAASPSEHSHDSWRPAGLDDSDESVPQGRMLRPWLYRITLNVVRNRLRRRQVPRAPLEAAGTQASQDSPGPAASAERSETRRELTAALAALPRRYREAVLLRHVEDLSYPEAAAVLARPVGTVKSDVHRGLAQLRAALHDQQLIGGQVHEY